MNKPYDGSAGVPGYSGAAKKTATCAAMTLWFAVAAVHGVLGMFAYRATAMHMDASMHIDAILVGNAVMIVSQAVRRRTASRECQCGRGHNYANCIERDQGYRTIKAPSGNKPAQHAVFTSGSDSILKRRSVSLKPGMRRNNVWYPCPAFWRDGEDAARREFVLALASRHEWGEAFAVRVASAMLLMPP